MCELLLSFVIIWCRDLIHAGFVTVICIYYCPPSHPPSHPPPPSSSSSFFPPSSGVISGSKTSEYLLEKSRIVSQAKGERNYHVFYEMLLGLPAEELEKYGLTNPSDYFYLNQAMLHEPCLTLHCVWYIYATLFFLSIYLSAGREGHGTCLVRMMSRISRGSFRPWTWWEYRYATV